MQHTPEILFVSTTSGYGWGGSEELWSQTALEFRKRGLAVSASVMEQYPLHPRALELRARGISLGTQAIWYSWQKHPWRWLMARRHGALAYSIRKLILSRR